MVRAAASSDMDRYPLARTCDVVEAREIFQRTYGEVDVDAVDGDHFEWRASLAALGGVAVIRGLTTAGVSLRFTSESYVITHFTEGVALAGSQGEMVDVTGAGGAAVFTSGHRASWRLIEDGRTATVRIDPTYLAAELAALTGETVHRPPEFAIPMDTHAGPGAAIRRLCVFLANEVEEGSELLEQRLVTGGLAETLVRALLMSQPHDHAHLLRRPTPSAGMSAVRKVEEYVESAGARRVPMREAVALTGASGRALDAALRAHRGATLDAVLATGVAALSPREREVCARVARGQLNKQIAADLGLAEATIKGHRARLMAKLGVDSAVGLGQLLERLRLTGAPVAVGGRPRP